MKTEKRGRGRPSTGKTYRVNFRITEEAYEKLIFSSEKFNMSKTELFNKMIEMQHNLAQFMD